MDVINLTNQLGCQPDKVIKILEKLGCEKIKYNEHKNYITSTRPEDGADNPLGNMVFLPSLVVHQNTRNYSGNLYTLIMDVKNINFPRSLELAANWAGLKISQSSSIKLPFGGFFKQISKQQKEPELNMKVYSEDDLPKPGGVSYKYIKDGVSAQTQEFFGVRFCHDNNAIIVPIYNYSGNLVGAKARNADPNCDMAHRFWATLEYSKSLILYGFIQNYRHIVRKKVVIVVESEKAVMQAYEMGCYLCVAVAGHSISETQAKYIKSLGANKIYLAFDEGVCEEELVYEAKKLVVDTHIVKNKVGYVFDESNILLPKGSKMSPTDQGKEIFNRLIKECTRWL